MIICYYCRGQVEDSASQCPHCGASPVRARQTGAQPKPEQENAGPSNGVTKFDAKMYFLSKDEGGRHTPVFVGYRPQFVFGETDVSGAVKAISGGAELIKPGDDIAIVVGSTVTIREGGRLVGKGAVTKIY